ncbi:hypothetical protein [Rhodopirellula sallentina]|uniref:Integral membrane protein n=1 Tax=Rhodopirellula sallentina SM41 TaxID=1263870 RepID=M5U7S0_9BACT|nr:hypothetical protein [Rhodopirellula sallentina]EMI57490.1 integral membrane protein [Rhodopirellula sallentina SM41]
MKTFTHRRRKLLGPLNDRSLRSSMLMATFLAIVGWCFAENTETQSIRLLGAPQLNESSGLGFSFRDLNCVWTHNDSGDRARLFCFDRTSGEATGRCELPGVRAIDWEAMASVPVTKDETAKLIIADCGDNDAVRPFISLYRFDEPDPHDNTKLDKADCEVLRVRFPGGPVDCEAVWYDPLEECTVLVAKGRLPIAAVYTVDDSLWEKAAQRSRTIASSLAEPSRAPEKGASDPQTVMATQITTLALPMATGGDRDPLTGDVWIASYFQAFRFPRGEYSRLSDQLGQLPVATEMPRLRQVEAIAVDEKGGVWVTTEGSQPLLHPIAPQATDSNATSVD